MYCARAQEFYDSEAVRQKMFAADWRLALQSHGLEKFICTHSDNGMRDLDGDGQRDEVAEVGHATREAHTRTHVASLFTRRCRSLRPIRTLLTVQRMHGTLQPNNPAALPYTEPPHCRMRVPWCPSQSERARKAPPP